MFKKLLYLIPALYLCIFNAVAQDSTAYNLQRAKINALLTERSISFDSYDQSLTARSGIFGSQTKRDLKNSNEILRQIVIKDNQLFKELKVLLDFRNLQVEETQSAANNSKESVLGYRKTIKELQVLLQNETSALANSEKSKGFLLIGLIFSLMVNALLIYRMMAARYRNQR